MKNTVLAAAVLALLAVPALAVPYSRATQATESFTVDAGRGYQASQPSCQAGSASCQQGQEQARSNWAPRGQQAQDQQASSEQAAPQGRQPRATKASGKPHHRAHGAAGQQPGQPAGHANAPAGSPNSANSPNGQAK